MRDETTELALLKDAIRKCANRCDIDTTGKCPNELLMEIGDRYERQTKVLILARERGVELEQRLREVIGGGSG